MNNTLKIILSLSLISLFSGLSLAALQDATKEEREIQILQNKQMPAVKKILSSADNDLLKDRQTLKLSDKESLLYFPAKTGGKVSGVAIETSGSGFGGKVGVMVGFDLATDKLIGIAITTMSETPGVGTRAKNDAFTKQFGGMTKDSVIKIKAEGGAIDAVTGATVTSKAVCDAVNSAFSLWQSNKDNIVKNIK